MIHQCMSHADAFCLNPHNSFSVRKEIRQHECHKTDWIMKENTCTNIFRTKIQSDGSIHRLILGMNLSNEAKRKNSSDSYRTHHLTLHKSLCKICTYQLVIEHIFLLIPWAQQDPHLSPITTSTYILHVKLLITAMT